MSAREEVLARVRLALSGGGGEEAVPRGYRGARSQDAGTAPELLDLLADRLVDYHAGVRRTGADQLAAAVAQSLSTGLERRHATLAAQPPPRSRVVIPPGLPGQWLTATDAELVTDEGLDTAALDEFDAVVTAATVAIAETGTIVLDASPDQGRRALTLVPDVHVCVVFAGQVVAGVPDALPRLDPRRALTWISGPSATSDIELDRVEGVHGPRFLEVVVVQP